MGNSDAVARNTGMPRKPVIAVILVLSVFYIASYFALATARIHYPYELDYTEGANAAEMAQLEAGRPAYTPASVHYFPLVYTPLNFYVAKVLNRLNPTDYFGLRLASIIGTIITSLVIVVTARKARAAAWATIAAVGVYLGAFTRCGFIMDTGHVDSLALAFSITALALLFEGSDSISTAALAGILAGLGFLTKQTMVVFIAIPFLWMVLRREWLRGFVFGIMSAGVIIALLTAWGLLFDRWFYFYTFGLESSIHISMRKLLLDAPLFLALTLPTGLLIGLLGCASGSSRWTEVPGKWARDPWAVTMLLYVGMSLLAKAKDGGGENVFLPVVALGAVQIGRYATGLAERGPRLVPALLIVQLAVIVYPPSLLWPVQADRDAGDRLVEQIRKIDGDVYIPAFPEYAVRAGKPWFAHYTMTCGRLKVQTDLRKEFGEMVKAQKFGAIFPREDIEEQDRGYCEVPYLEEFYEPLEDVIIPPRPSISDVLKGKPSLSGIAHGGKFTKVYVPRRLPPEGAPKK